MTIPKPPSKALRRLTEASQTLHCRCPLPPNPAIFYAKFAPDNTLEEPHKTVENARQNLIKDVSGNSIGLTESLLPFVNISNRSVYLWVFCVRSRDALPGTSRSLSSKGKEKSPAHLWSDLEALCFPGLQRVHMGDFAPTDIFSCSPTCATLSRSCPACASATLAMDQNSWHSSSSMLFSRSSLRDVYLMFTRAVRQRFINTVCTQKSTNDMSSGDKSSFRAVRFGEGFLTIGEYPNSIWSHGWERHSQAKYLVHTALDVYLTITAIYIRPMPSVTKLLPTPFAFQPRTTRHTTLSPGTPLVLAPYPTPAFYISTHEPSTIPSSLRNEFWHTLKGLGALHDLRNNQRRSNSRHKTGSPESRFIDDPFILVYISLNNPRGKPKGLSALWPVGLTFIDTDPNRIRLTTLPEIPGIETLLTPPRPSVNAASDLSCMIGGSLHIPNRTIFRNSSKQLKGTQRVMRTLELHTRRRIPGLPIHEAAKSTAGYIESVAKEREREREKANSERLRREKESKDKTPSSNSGLGSMSSQPLSTSAPSTPSVLAASIPQKPTQDITVSTTSSWRSTSSHFFTRTAQDTISYSFYPSPPDCNLSHASVTAGDSTSGPFGSSASTMSAHVSNILSTPHNMQTGSMGLSNDMDLGMDIDLNDINIGIDLSRSMDIMNVNVDSDLVDGGFGSFGDALITDDDFDYFDKTIVPEHLPGSTTSVLDNDIPSWLDNALTSGSIMSPINTSPQRLNSTCPEDTVSLMPPELYPSTPTARSPPTPSNPRTPSLEILATLTSPKDQPFEPVYFSDRHHLADDKYTGSGGKFLLNNLRSRATPPPDDVITGKKIDSWRFRYDALTDPRVGVVNRLRGVKRKLSNDLPTVKNLKRSLREEEEWGSMFIEDSDNALDSSSSQDEDDEELDNMEFDGDYAEVPSRESLSRPTTPSPVGHPLSPPLLYYQLEHSLLLPLATAMRPSLKELISSEAPSVAMSVPTPVSPAAALGSAAERNKTLELMAQAMSKEHVENSFWAHSSDLASPFSLPPRFVIPQEHILELLNLLKQIPGIEISLPISELLAAPSDVSSSPLCSPYEPKLLNQPKFSLGRAGLVHHICPSALRFWEKEGLGPRAGTKDVVAFCLFQDGEGKAAIVASWLERVARTYTARNFGIHVPGDAGPFGKGLVPLQFESVRKVLTQLLTALTLIPHVPHIVVYIIAPPSLFSSLESPVLRSIIRSRKYTPKCAGQRDFDNDRILFHFVPDNHIADPYVYPSTRYLGLERFVQSVYDRLLRVCDKPLPLRSPINSVNVDVVSQAPFQAPAFVLARSGPPETCFQWEERPPLNVLDQHTFLHVGYRLSKCKKWLSAACIDERGEAHDLAIWNVPYHSEDDQSTRGDIDVNMGWVVENIWLFASQFIKRGNTEWKIVLSRFDEITEHELEVWITHLETAILDHQGPPFHVSLVFAQSDIPLSLVPSTNETQRQKQPSLTSVAPPGSVFMDASLLTYSLLFPGRAPIIPSSHLYPADQPSVLGPNPTETDSETMDSDADIVSPFPDTFNTPIIPLSSSALFTVPNASNDTSDPGEAVGSDATLVGALYIHMLYACKTSKSTLRKSLQDMLADITQSWYDISILTRERWSISGLTEHGASTSLPFHLAALDIMLSLSTVNADPHGKDFESV